MYKIRTTYINHKQSFKLVEISMMHTAINPTASHKVLNDQPRYFILCESCFWSASIIKLMAPKVSCPLCANDNVYMIPLAINESYSLNLSPKTGLDISFHTTKNLLRQF